MSKSVLSDILATFRESSPDMRSRKAEQKETVIDPVDPPGRLRNEVVGKEFTYPPLESGPRSLRLLQLLPGSRHDDICCTLEVQHDLTNCAGTYETLSYVWAPKKVSHESTPIQVDDKTLYIGSNLRVALYHLRHEGKPRTLWVDALCINQSCLEERNQQVGIMGDIYRSSSCTIIWLGDSIEPTARAFRVLEELSSEVATQENIYTGQVGNDPVLSVISAHIREPIPSPLFERYKADGSIIHLGADDWWYRAWTSQEILLSPQALVMKGSFSMPWDRVCSGMNYGLAVGMWSPLVLAIIVNPIIVPYMTLLKLRSRRQQLHQLLSVEPYHPYLCESQQLLDNLVSCRFRGATDLRDKVYGVLGLTITTSQGTEVKHKESLDITPDYNLSYREVYRHTARRLIIHSRSLNVLGACTSPPDAQLPTWVPDWSFTGYVPTLLTNDAFDQPRTTNASRGSEAKPRFENAGNDIVLQGHELTTIAALAPIMHRWVMITGTDSNALETKAHTTILGKPFEALRLKMMLVGGIYEFLMCIVPHLGIWADWDAFALETELRNPDGAVNGEGDPMTVYWQTLTTGTFLPSGSNTRTHNVPIATKAGGLGTEEGVGKQHGIASDYDERQRKRETAKAFYTWRGSLKAVRNMHQWGVDLRFRPVAFLGYVLNTWNKYSDFARLLENTYKRRLARCENGYLALVPATAEVGDKVVLLEGGAVPLVLRQDVNQDGSDNCYQLVGEAFIHGVMNGEAFQEGNLMAFRLK
ncbi:heterokaryon incompatibility protein-domain-containing protein [Xylaria arbuscula]|nr:heterokaryon incompatibility protein-domain-containing protein [Xylaria arbuscula]